MSYIPIEKSKRVTFFLEERGWHKIDENWIGKQKDDHYFVEHTSKDICIAFWWDEEVKYKYTPSCPPPPEIKELVANAFAEAGWK